MGRGAAVGAPADARRRHHGLPRLGARRPPPQARRNERALARDGRHAEFRPVQPRPSDLCRIEVVGYREAVRATVGDCTGIVGWAKARLRRAHHRFVSRESWWARYALPIYEPDAFKNTNSVSS